MTRNTRFFLAGSAAVLVAGLCTGLVAYYGGGFQALSASTGPPVLRAGPPRAAFPSSAAGFQPLPASTGPLELRYVPPDAAVIAYADVGAIMNSELRLRIKEAMPMHQPGPEEVHAAT